MAGAAAFTEMMANATPLGFKDSTGPLNLTWPEPLAPAAGREVTRINTLFRSADVHNRVLRMAELFFTRAQLNELKQMIGMSVGGGRYVEPTWTLAEGQAVMATPGFADKVQREGIAAFYDYVFTIDWLMHRIDTLESLLSLLGDTKRSSPDEIRFLQSQLDGVLMSPHGMPWYMWERDGVQALVTPNPKAPEKMGLMNFASKYIQLLTGQRALSKADPLQPFVAELESGSAFKGPVPNAAVPAAADWENLLLLCVAAQEAVLLSSPLWNDLVALGQGLYRVQLTKGSKDATTELGVVAGAVPLEPGAWINTFRAQQPFLNVFPSTDSTDNAKKLLIDSADFIPEGNSVGLGDSLKNVAAFIKAQAGTKPAATAYLMKHQQATAEAFQAAATVFNPTLTVASLNANARNPDDTSRRSGGTTAPLQSEQQCVAAFLQPKLKDCALYAAAGLGLFFPETDLRALETEFAQAGDKHALMLRRCMTHSGSGGAIGSYVCTGAAERAAAFVEKKAGGSAPQVFRVTTKILHKCVERMPDGHPTKWMPKLWDCMQKAVAYDAADAKKQQLDPSARQDRPARTLIDYMRERIRDLQHRYAAIRNARANVPVHPLATAQDLFSPEYSAPGAGILPTHHALPQCPVGTVPLIFDTVRKNRLSPQEWQKQVVEVNGQKLLPDTLQVQACLPGRALASIPQKP
jgi:hypothetical protein